ncbi:MAG TPA: ABC transporter ATP-binding protein [Steroidobacteraceae bacterium]|nr:ABC transporter ATP-binding protein [Steroidobacteraceae bacterium]
MLLEIDGLRRGFGSVQAVQDLTLRLEVGQIGCLLGPSGCGKTTALRCIAGFEGLDAGEIRAGGRVLGGVGTRVPPEARGIGMVFQDYALFPHLDVARNIGFGLHRLQPRERDGRVDALLQLVGLEACADRFPHELSGGQQQRVALARALAPQPQLVLLDEPFSNLDVELRERLSYEVRGILKRFGTTALLVTHDQHEAFALADLVGVMRHGRLEQWSTPYDLYHRPATRFVADFVGAGTFLPGCVISPGTVEFECGVLRDRALGRFTAGERVEILVRPEDVVLDARSELAAVIVERAFRGADYLYSLRLPGGGEVLSLARSHEEHPVGGTVGVRVELEHVVAFAAEPSQSGAAATEPAIASEARATGTCGAPVRGTKARQSVR